MKVLIEELLKKYPLSIVPRQLKKLYPKKYQELFSLTSYLPENTKISERIYHIFNNIKTIPKCHCGNSLKFIGFVSGYQKYCSMKCIQTQEHIKKVKQTKFERYGNENYTNIEKMKITKLEKYGNEKYNNPEKITSSLQNKDNWDNILIKRKNTIIKKYGSIDRYNTIRNEKVKKTFKEKYNNEKYVNVNKGRETQHRNSYLRLLESDRLKNMITPLFSIDKYKGTKTFEKRKKYQFQCKKCGNIFEDGLYDGRIPRCGICYPLEWGERGKKGYYEGIYCASSWELAFVIFCLNNNIEIKRNDKGFEYWFENTKHKYYPDFYLPEVDQYIEIKGYEPKDKIIKNQEKWNQFPYKLDVYNTDKIKPILNEIQNNYGKNFIRLYEEK